MKYFVDATELSQLADAQIYLDRVTFGISTICSELDIEIYRHVCGRMGLDVYGYAMNRNNANI